MCLLELRRGFGNASPYNGGGGDGEEGEIRHEWDFSLAAVVSSPASGAASDAIGVLEFDQTENLLATGGIARKIRIYAMNKMLDLAGSGMEAVMDHGDVCEFCICTPAKLSSLRWKPGMESKVIGAGDYDGVITEYDLEKHVPVYERDEHGGRRVYTIDYSHGDSVTIGASGSDDGTMQLWDSRCDPGCTVAIVRPDPYSGSPVCSVEFNPFVEHIVAVGCADRRIYGYDIRATAVPVFILDGHEKAVAYTKFLDPRTLVSSSIDGCLKMWRPEAEHRLVRTYKGHSNSRRFVGLSVWRNGGLLCCGSENNHVFVYDRKWSDPIWVHGFRSATSTTRSTSGFVGSVCWKQSSGGECTMVAGSSDGVLQVYHGEKRPEFA